jgi:glucose dehydrogenase
LLQRLATLANSCPVHGENASKLSLAYSFSLASLRSNESSPIVIGDTLYVSSSWGPKYVYALDAATGARKWTWEPDIPDDALQYACCDITIEASPMPTARSSSAVSTAS